MTEPRGDSRLAAALAGRYEIQRELGRGGMATVFLARDVRHGRPVAIKVLDPELSASLGTARFVREVETAARLSHPHIVPVHDSGDAAGLLYYVMPYVDGESLRARLNRERPLTPEETARLAREIAESLDYAHEHGVIHRDIKPENVLLSRGHALVTDFGVARAVANATEGVARETLTQTGLAVGTPAYMSPEQAAGDHDVDRRSDVYSLGCVVYEMLTGSTPFSGTSTEQIASRFRESPPAPSSRRMGLPAAIDAVLGRALALTPSGRFATAGELAHALTEAIAGRGSLGSTTQLQTAPAGATVRARRTVRAAAAVVGAGALAAAVWCGVTLRDVPASGAADRKRLAVLPFKNLGRPDDGYFADGVTEEITSRLALLSGLHVFSRTSTDKYRNTTPLAEIARDLGGVDYVLRGSVRWERPASGNSPGRVRVTPQLIRASDDSHIWTDIIDDNAADVFRVQATIAERVAEALEVAVGSGERAALGARATASFEAYNHYLRAQELIPNSDPVRLRTAAELLEQAVRLDSQFALAYVALYRTQLTRSALTVGDTNAAREAREAMSTAVRLAPDLPEVALARGAQYLLEQQDPDRALQQFERVKARVPSSAEAATLIGMARMAQGRWLEARRSFDEAIALDPRNADAAYMAFVVAFSTRDSVMARRYVDRLIAIQPDNPLYYGSKAVLAATLGNNTREAAIAMREAVTRFGGPRAAYAILDAPLAVLPHVDTVTQNALVRVALNTFPGDTAAYYFFKAALHRTRRERALERSYADSAIRFVEARSKPASLSRAYRYTLAISYTQLGQAAEAVALAKQAVARSSATAGANDRTLDRQILAEVYALLGHDEAALAELEYLLSISSNISIPWLRTGATWDSLRDNPRFQRLVGPDAKR